MIVPLSSTIVVFLYGFIAGYAFSNVGVKFEKMKLKSERKCLKRERQECYQARKKYEDYKRIENNLIKHDFLKNGKE